MVYFYLAIAAYEIVHLFAELMIKTPKGGECRSVVVMPSRGGRDLRRFVGYVDYVVVDHVSDGAKAGEVGLRWFLNKYSGKSGALATALETIDAELYVFIDDDAYPGPWLRHLRSMCGRFATAYRWVLGRIHNAFSLGGFDWMVWRRTRFLYGGAMTVPASRRWEAAEALKRCAVDDMALTAVAGEIEVLPVLVPMDPPGEAWGFFMRQAVAAKIGNPRLWLVETLYYVAWTVAALFFPVLFLIHAVRTALRSRRALGRVDWAQVALSPLERPLQAVVFLASVFKQCFTWRGTTICSRC